MKNEIKEFSRGHSEAFQKSFTAGQIDLLEKIGHEIIRALKAGHKILLCGNGGSAADAQHIAAEFVGRFEKDRMSLPAIALNTDTSAITAISNDYGYDRVFSRQVEGLGSKGDILIAISTSGKSASVLKAVDAAKEKGLVTIGFSGKDGGKLVNAVDICFLSRSEKTAHIQEMHITALHAICEAVDKILFA